MKVLNKCLLADDGGLVSCSLSSAESSIKHQHQAHGYW